MGISLDAIEQLKRLIEEKLAICQHIKRAPLYKSDDLLQSIIIEIGTILCLDKNYTESSLYEPESGPYMVYIHEQLRQSYRHVCLESSIGMYPFDACIKFLEETQNFLTILQPQEAISAAIDRPAVSKDVFDIYKQEDKQFIVEVQKNPMEIYRQLRERLKDNPNAPFSEFRNKIEYLKLMAHDEAVLEQASKDKQLAAMRITALRKLEEVAFKGCPYLQTIDAIEQFTAFMDVYQRGRPGGIAPPLYHNHRWRYHAHQMKAEVPDYIIIPTLSELTISEIVKIRAIPMGFVGIKVDISYVDGHRQTPLEFWFHDFNHSRRMLEQQKLIAKERRISFEDYAEQCDRYVQERIAPVLSISPSLADYQKDIKRIQKAILFEIVHEDALPADADVIQESLARPPFAVSRFFINETQHKAGKVLYSTDPNATVLSFVYRKLAGDFYDSREKRIAGLGRPQARTRSMVLNAAKQLVAQLGLQITDEQLETNINDDSGLPQGFRSHVLELLAKDPSCMDPLNETASEGLLGFDEGLHLSRTAVAVVSPEVEVGYTPSQLMVANKAVLWKLDSEESATAAAGAAPPKSSI